ncbi:MAG: hypothetical protein JXA11_00295 [Phycisphaerae bacterium]|nr:hypothetical protein [Phycisphaerae bacterium]
MDFHEDKVDEMTLALMYLVTHGDKYGSRAWKGFDWGTMDRPQEKGYISDPKSKARSVVMTDEGFQLSKELFQTYFEIPK